MDFKNAVLLFFCLVSFFVRLAHGGNGKKRFQERVISKSPFLIPKEKTVSLAEVGKRPVFASSNINKKFTSLPQLDFIPRGRIRQPKSAGVSRRKPMIIGGSGAIISQFPWATVLILDNSYICGGSLITDSFILTAAHCCLNVSRVIATGGGIDRNLKENGEFVVRANKTIVHPKYNDKLLTNDICIVQIPTVTLTTSVNLIRLPSIGDASKTFFNSSVLVAGHGKTSNNGSVSNLLTYVSLTVISNLKCATYYGDTIRPTILCTGGNALKSACHGDSGGALMVKETDGLYTAIGVVSFVSAEACLTNPTGFTRVSSYLGWISQQTSIRIRPRSNVAGGTYPAASKQPKVNKNALL